MSSFHLRIVERVFRARTADPFQDSFELREPITVFWRLVRLSSALSFFGMAGSILNKD